MLDTHSNLLKSVNQTRPSKSTINDIAAFSSRASALPAADLAATKPPLLLHLSPPLLERFDDNAQPQGRPPAAVNRSRHFLPAQRGSSDWRSRVRKPAAPWDWHATLDELAPIQRFETANWVFGMVGGSFDSDK